MSDSLLETYIAGHIAASPDEIIRFSWHGGEPTLLGLDFFRKAVSLQRKHARPGRRIANGMQTNGTLLDADWGRFLAEERFSVGISLDGPAGDPRPAPREQGRPAELQAGDARLRDPAPVRRLDGRPVRGRRAQRRPAPEVYGFFKSIEASYVSFLPLVERRPGNAAGDEVEPGIRPGRGMGRFSLRRLRRVGRRRHRPDQGPDLRGSGPDGLRPGAFALPLPAGLRRRSRPRAQRRPLFLRPFRRRRPPAGEHRRDRRSTR